MNITLRGGRINPWLIVVATVGALFAVIFLALGLLLSQEGTKKDDLETQLAQARRILSSPRQGLTVLREDAARARALIPDRVEETEVFRFIREVADRHNVFVSSQSDFGTAPGRVGTTVYDLTNFKLEATGQYGDLRQFVEDLESQMTMATLVVGRTSIQGGPGTIVARVSLDYAVYARQGGG